MSNIIVGTTTTTGYSVEADDSGVLVIKTGPDANVAMIIDENQSTAFTGNVQFDGSKLRVSGGEAGQVWTSDGAGNNSWTDPGVGFDPTVVHTFTATQNLVSDQSLGASRSHTISAVLGTTIEPVKWCYGNSPERFEIVSGGTEVDSFLNLGTNTYYGGGSVNIIEARDFNSTSGNPTRLIGPSATLNLKIAPSSTETYATILNNYESLTQVFVVRNNYNPIYIDNLTVEGMPAIEMYWQGGSAPTSGTANGVDVYKFTIMRTSTIPLSGGPILTRGMVLASVTSFADSPPLS